MRNINEISDIKKQDFRYEKEMNFETRSVKVVNYKDSLDVALKVLKSLD